MKHNKGLVLQLVLAALIFSWSFCAESHALRWHTLGSDWDLSIEPELRVAYNETTNTGDLNDSTGDNLNYASYIYNIPVRVTHKGETTFFINLISEGSSHYAAPLKDLDPFVEGVSIHKNGDFGSALYPGVSELWFKVHPASGLNLQFGQSPYKVGNGYALGGQYNNYGVTVLYEGSPNVTARLRFSKLDFENRLYGIGHNTMERWSLGRSDDSEASLFAADVTFRSGRHSFQPYLGFLKDSTAASHRMQHGYYTNLLQAFEARRDKIITLGLSTKLDFQRVSVELEGARNFGQTISNTSGWEDIDHEGYIIHAAVKGHLGMFTPRARVVVASGNEVDVSDPAAYLAGTLKRTENKAFTVFSPVNTNLVDSYAHIASVPVIAMAGGYPMNYGIRRPGTFNDPHVWENIAAYNLGVNIVPFNKAFVMIDLWHLRALEAAIGQSSVGGSYEYLSKDIGNEIDIYATYEFTKIITAGIHGGYFWPGGYYKETRVDSLFLWNNNLSQTVRTDGSADDAHQMEVFVTLKF